MQANMQGMSWGAGEKGLEDPASALESYPAEQSLEPFCEVHAACFKCSSVAGTPAGPCAHYNSSHCAAIDAKVCFNVIAFRAIFVHLAFVVFIHVSARLPRYRHIEDVCGVLFD
ncbi:hypothetical protein T09_7924 [Trichinella sp. T9]|nr:hypothetical protein T09_7924 [Trichinella sp. T9]